MKEFEGKTIVSGHKIELITEVPPNKVFVVFRSELEQRHTIYNKEEVAEIIQYLTNIDAGDNLKFNPNAYQKWNFHTYHGVILSHESVRVPVFWMFGTDNPKTLYVNLEALHSNELEILIENIGNYSIQAHFIPLSVYEAPDIERQNADKQYENLLRVLLNYPFNDLPDILTLEKEFARNLITNWSGIIPLEFGGPFEARGATGPRMSIAGYATFIKSDLKDTDVVQSQSFDGRIVASLKIYAGKQWLLYEDGFVQEIE